MKKLRKHLEKLRSIKRHRYHPLIHKLHKKHGISKKTLLYVKEYGPRSHVPGTIIKESIKILLFASLLSSLGGLALENFKILFVSIVPLVVLLPALNNLIGEYGIIVSSRFATILHAGNFKGIWYKKPELKKLFVQVLIISIATAMLSSFLAIIISYFSSYNLTIKIAYKVLLIGIIDTTLILSILFSIAMVAGLHYYKKGEDPNNFLIPITTSIADFGNMLILTLLVLLFF